MHAKRSVIGMPVTPAMYCGVMSTRPFLSASASRNSHAAVSGYWPQREPVKTERKTGV
jgi:hypothetical protein